MITNLNTGVVYQSLQSALNGLAQSNSVDVILEIDSDLKGKDAEFYIPNLQFTNSELTIRSKSGTVKLSSDSVSPFYINQARGLKFQGLHFEVSHEKANCIFINETGSNLLTFENCYFTSLAVNPSDLFVAGDVTGLTIDNCIFSSTNNRAVGIKQASGEIAIKNCDISGTDLIGSPLIEIAGKGLIETNLMVSGSSITADSGALLKLNSINSIAIERCNLSTGLSDQVYQLINIQDRIGNINKAVYLKSNLIRLGRDGIKNESPLQTFEAIGNTISLPVNTERKVALSVLFVSNLKIKSNIFFNSEVTTSTYFVTSTSSILDIDKNVYQPNPDQLFPFEYEGSRLSFSDWKAATGKDLLSEYASPIFVDGYYLADNSPGRATGVGTIDVFGQTSENPNVGAFFAVEPPTLQVNPVYFAVFNQSLKLWRYSSAANESAIQLLPNETLSTLYIEEDTRSGELPVSLSEIGYRGDWRYSTTHFWFCAGRRKWLKWRLGDDGTVGTAVAWDDITGKPTTFAPSAHVHTVNDVTGLSAVLSSIQSEIASKANINHSHSPASIGAMPMPTGGEAGMVATKTASGVEWKFIQSSGGGSTVIESPVVIVRNESELIAAVSKMNQSLGSGWIILGDNITLTADRTLNLTGITIFGNGRRLAFGDSYYGGVGGQYILTIQGAAVLRNVSLTGNLSFGARNLSQKILKLENGASLSMFECRFSDVLGSFASANPIIECIGTGTWSQIKLYNCDASTRGSDPKPYSGLSIALNCNLSGLNIHIVDFQTAESSAGALSNSKLHLFGTGTINVKNLHYDASIEVKTDNFGFSYDLTTSVDFIKKQFKDTGYLNGIKETSEILFFNPETSRLQVATIASLLGLIGRYETTFTNTTEKIITHNYQRYPLVSVINSVGDTIVTQVTHIDRNTVRVSWVDPMSGTIILY